MLVEVNKYFFKNNQNFQNSNFIFLSKFPLFPSLEYFEFFEFIFPLYSLSFDFEFFQEKIYPDSPKF
jgi:hypothetical protein